MDCIDKEVMFGKYCPQCEHADLPDTEDPCFECMDEPVREYTHKPLYFKQHGGSGVGLKGSGSGCGGCCKK